MPRIGRPPMQPGRARSNAIHIRLRPTERVQVVSAAKQAGVTLAEFIRNAILRQRACRVASRQNPPLRKSLPAGEQTRRAAPLAARREADSLERKNDG